MRVPIRRKKPTPAPSERQGVCEYPRYQGCTGARFTDRTEPFGKSESGQELPVMTCPKIPPNRTLACSSMDARRTALRIVRDSQQSLRCRVDRHLDQGAVHLCALAPGSAGSLEGSNDAPSAFDFGALGRQN